MTDYDHRVKTEADVKAAIIAAFMESAIKTGGKRSSILQQAVAVLSGLTKAWKNGDLATGCRQIDEYITMKKLKDLSESDRPREKLQARGPEALSELELLAILLGSGTRDSDVLTVAGRILKAIDGGNDQVSLDKLQEIEGVAPAKASLIAAALEFARRRIRREGLRISFPSDALPLIRHFADRRQEHFICVSLNGANEVIATRVVSVGLVNKTQVHPREVFADPITDRASAVIVAHNHP